MKFTNGFWLIKEEYSPLFCIEYFDHTFDGENLYVYACSKHVEDRGSILNTSVLKVKFFSPLDDVIGVKLTHFEGQKETLPTFKLNKTNTKISFNETEDLLIFSSGDLRAEISKKPNDWNIKYYRNNTLLTSSEKKSEAHFQERISKNTYTVESLSIDIDETLYGLGERFTPFVKNGQNVEIWNEDGGTSSQQAYKNIPFYISNKGYGVFVNSPKDVSFEIASEKVEQVQFSLSGEKLEYYIISEDSNKKVIGKYCQLTGYPSLPPAWSFGLWLTTSFTTNYDEKTTSYFIDGMKEREIPLSVFHFDCYWMKGVEWCNFTWDPETFPHPKKMLDRYHDKNLKICVWINPYIAQKSYLFDEGQKLGYFVSKTNGDIWQTDMWQAGMALVDFTNPDATKWYKEKLKSLLDMGVDCFKTDFGERIPVRNISYFDNSDTVSMHNYYTYLYNKAVFDLLKEVKGEGEAVLFARSATVGSQAFPVHWGGDCSATYPSMAETLRSGLSLSCSGFGYWSNDIGGFESTASADIYKRWCQFGLLCSHSRLHGSSSYRVPWLFDDEASLVLKKFSNLKCLLMPQLYSHAVEAHEQGFPMLRAMFLEFEGDRAVDYLDKQYLLGDSLLVAPIFKETGEVDYYLPKGLWYNILTDKEYVGNTWIKEKYDYFSMPLLLRENSILLVGYRDDRPDYEFEKDLTIKLSHFVEGAKRIKNVYNQYGVLVGTITVLCLNSELNVQCDGVLTNPKFISLSNQKINIEKRI